MRLALGITIALALAALPSSAAAAPVELQAYAGASAQKSTWRGDYGIGSTLRVGARFWRWLAVDFQAWESFATVDSRLNTGLSLGATAYLPLGSVRPYLRVFGIHQHEEGLVSVEHAPVGVVLGIGDGIRHRAGGGLSLGAAIPIKKANDKLTWIFFADTTATFLAGTLGPGAYYSLNLGLGLDYLL